MGLGLLLTVCFLVSAVVINKRICVQYCVCSLLEVFCYYCDAAICICLLLQNTVSVFQFKSKVGLI